MPQMAYFRRPQLAGKSIKYPTSAAVRGNLRRKDTDANVAYPYFANVDQNSTLIVETWDPTNQILVQRTVTFSSTPAANARIDTVLTELNSQLSAIQVQAYDEGGCIGLRSLRSGSDSLVRVVGGTAAAALGFDTGAQSFRAVGGDVVSTTEGRVRQPFGSALPNTGEGLSTETFIRALSRVMANTDVLYAELMRKDAVLARVATVTAASSLSTYTLPASTRIFSAGVPAGSGLTPLLTAGSSKETLAHFFFVVDTATKQISQCRVTNVTGPNSGALGVEQTVVGPLAINYVKNGRIVYVSSGAFTTSGILPGDYVSIINAQNNDPWSNNGYRWVVEEVMDDENLALRPMTPTELAIVGTTVRDEQPIVELNSNQSGSQSWGSLSIARGPYMANATLTFSPPLPTGFTGELWACVPLSHRERQLQALTDQDYYLFSAPAANFDTAPNAILSRPSLSIVAPNITVGAFMVRWHGRAVRVPASTLNFSSAGNGTTQYIYWDENDCQVKFTATTTFMATEARSGGTVDELAGVTPSTAGKGKQIATVAVTNPSFLTLTPTTVVEATDTLSLTVGPGTNFNSQTVSGTTFDGLQEAFEHLRSLSASGQPFHWAEILVTGPLTAPNGGWNVPCSGIRVRGASPDVVLTHGTTGALFNVSGVETFLLEDVTVDLTKNVTSGTSPSIFVRGLRHSLNATLRRSIDSPNQNVDIGYTAPAVDLGKAGAPTNVRGRLDVTQTTAFHDNAVADATKKIQVGADGQAGSKLDVSGTVGRLVLGKTGEADRPLDKDQLDVLIGGSGSDAQLLHTHADINSNLSLEISNRQSAISALQPSGAPPDIAGTGAVGSDGSHFARADHTHKGVRVVTSAAGPITVANGDTAPALTLPKSDSTHDGYLSAGDWNLFGGVSGKVNRAGDTMTGPLTVQGDITAYRAGGTTGVVFLNSAATRYLYWDGTSYWLGSYVAYHTGNFDPNVKADKAQLLGLVNAAGVSPKASAGGAWDGVSSGGNINIVSDSYYVADWTWFLCIGYATCCATGANGNIGISIKIDGNPIASSSSWAGGGELALLTIGGFQSSPGSHSVTMTLNGISTGAAMRGSRGVYMISCNG